MCPGPNGPSKIMGTSTLHIPHGTHTKCAWDHYSQQTRKMPTSPGAAAGWEHDGQIIRELKTCRL